MEDLKGLILSGGKGTRLRPITHTSAKQLVPVANKPVLFYGIEALRDAGITDIGIIVGDTQAEIRKACGDGYHCKQCPTSRPLRGTDRAHRTGEYSEQQESDAPVSAEVHLGQHGQCSRVREYLRDGEFSDACRLQQKPCSA